MLRLDNDHPEYVIAFLGDLGQELPYKEQLHWQSQNIEPDGTLSKVAFQRNLMAEFAEPERTDLLFKSKFERFQTEWIDRFGWHLFRPLVTEDQQYYKSIRIPITTDLAEFDHLVLCLTQLLVESLNDKKLVSAAVSNERGARSIDKFKQFLKHHLYPHESRDVRFLRDLQELRSTGTAHRKGKGYSRIAADFGLDERPIPDVYEDILRRAILLLDSLRDHFLA